MSMPSATPPSAVESRILDLIDRDEIVRLTTDLVAAPGTNPPGGEAATAAVLAAAALAAGLAVEVTEVEPDRPNVTVRLDGADGKGLLLLGHTDVVPIGEGWTGQPFGGLQRGGRLHGRGTADMKGGLAAAIAAMSALRRAGVPLSGPVELAAVIDEEETGKGVRHYLAQADRSGFLGCIVTEPTDLQTVVAARGDCYLEIEIIGRAAHSGSPAEGSNAIYGAAAVIGEIQRRHQDAAIAAHPLVGPATWSVGLVRGGTGVSVVPAGCTLVVDRRLLPGESPDEVLAAFRRQIAGLGLDRQGLTLTVSMTMQMPGFETDPAHPFVTVTDAALAAVGGPGLPLGGWPAACDGGQVAAGTGIPVLVLGPGSVAGQAHRPDESVSIDDLLVAARAYALAALRLLGDREHPPIAES